MINIALNIIGLILIIYSIFIIRKDFLTRETAINDLSSMEERMKEYYNLTEEIVEEFDEIIHSKLEKIYKENDKFHNNKLYNLNINENNSIDKDNLNNTNTNLNLFHNKIIELRKIGLTNEEIAKKLNKGIREIEIILKMYGDNKGINWGITMFRKVHVGVK